jgi:sirohydrochlorin cobaltochelatase
LKRYRHYNKDKAIILSCFGSVVSYKLYEELKKRVEEEFKECDVFISFGSRMVIKKLKKEGIEYKNLPQVLADVDMLGYKNIIVSSINLFPTDEHRVLVEIVEGFKNFSLSNIRATGAIFDKAKQTTKFLVSLSKRVEKENEASFFVAHGAPDFRSSGLHSYNYVVDFLQRIRELNVVCSLEGSYPYYALKDAIVEKLQRKGVRKVNITPLLLVSGNHFLNDIKEIKEELGDSFEVEVNEISLLNEEEIVSIILESINNEIIKLGIN